jgi:hypothetical protein
VPSMTQMYHDTQRRSDEGNAGAAAELDELCAVMRDEREQEMYERRRRAAWDRVPVEEWPGGFAEGRRRNGERPTGWPDDSPF